MRIALLAPIEAYTPPESYVWWRKIVPCLIEGMIARGLDVTLFDVTAPESSSRLPTIQSKLSQGSKSLDRGTWELLFISEFFERCEEFHFIHNHAGFVPLTYARLVQTPILTTIYGLCPQEILAICRELDRKTFFVSTSNASRVRGVPYAATVYQGIDVRSSIFRDSPHNYLLALAPIHPASGLMKAIDIARLSGKDLLIVGAMEDQEYFHTNVKARLDDKHIRYIDGAPGGSLAETTGNALALLHLTKSDESSYLAALEANACGTPVIAFSRASTAEIVTQGVNGFIVHDVSAGVEAVDRIQDISRSECRKLASDLFSVDRMVDNYLRVYARILEKTKQEHLRPWGYYEVLSEKSDHKVKRIVVFPGRRLSLQSHRRRSEQWTVVSGSPAVVHKNEEIILSPGESIHIPVGAAHRVANFGTEPVVLIEVQTGDYFGEDDIERLEDDFGRTGENQ